MNYTVTELKKGIKVHFIETNKFKTNLFSIFITTPITRENVTKNALLAKVLRRGSSLYNTQDKISIELEEMYGAELDCGIDKIGDDQVIKFYLEALNDKYVPEKEKITKKCIEIIANIVFNPYCIDNKFNAEYVQGEKENLKQLILGKIDNKNKYALDRCTEEMCKDKPYGLYKFGYVEDLEEINEESLYVYYKELISNSKIDIFISGDFEKNNMMELIKQNKDIEGLSQRDAKIAEDVKIEKVSQIKKVEDNMDVSQGKLVIGLNTNEENIDDMYTALMYNAILGGGANSKLFQNVREKESLAYTAGSNYVKTKGIIFIRCGIEIQNYEKAVNVIKQQLEDMKNGNFTEEDLENSKKLILAGIKNISEEQDTEITYYLGQELAGTNVPLEEYETKISKITKQDIVELANKVTINTIYFLKN